MDEKYSVKLSKVINEFGLETVYLPDLPENVEIDSTKVNRPGLQMVGFYDHYERERVQIVGKVENLYLATLPAEERRRRVVEFFATRPVAVIVTTSIEIEDETVALAEEYRVPLLRTSKQRRPLLP